MPTRTGLRVFRIRVHQNGDFAPVGNRAGRELSRNFLRLPGILGACCGLCTTVTLEQTLRSGLHPLLAQRFSPDRFDPAGTVGDEELELLLEAARWAPSAGNSQPWAFFPARPCEPEHDLLIRHLAASSARWAPDAGALIVTLTRRFVDDPTIQYSEFADYDLGQAVAHLTVQAQALGLACHQFRAFDADGLTTMLQPDPGWAVVSMIAVGTPASALPPARNRRDTNDLRAAPWASRGTGNRP
ncbi:nitroreductase [Nocardia cyriacigeorgica]|uniref:Nitroreductase n=1 Tax=Nocardia cyriacigeorgica TaxID=135487 RepID=A0ABX0CMI6_9NOCA|nr:nitroreductase [Nocardia cyriacigeorgica]